MAIKLHSDRGRRFMRELFRQRPAQQRRLARPGKTLRQEHDDVRDSIRSGPATRQRRQASAWREVLDSIDDADLPPLWALRPVGKGRLR